MVKKKELKSMTASEQDKQLADMQMELMKANSQVASGSAPKNPGQIKQLRKTVARILTLKNMQKTEDVKSDGGN